MGPSSYNRGEAFACSVFAAVWTIKRRHKHLFAKFSKSIAFMGNFLYNKIKKSKGEPFRRFFAKTGGYWNGRKE